MVQKIGKRKLISALVVLVALLVGIAVVALVRANTQNATTNPSSSAQDTSSSDTEAIDDSGTQDTSKPTDASRGADASNTETTLDPAKVSTIDISPISLTVSYVKGIGPFEYEVLRTTNGTRYVEFKSPDLIGTKCTNDTGVFASILADPDSNESSTLAKTVTVDGTKYGLSLEPSTCTADESKLQAYQKSFGDAFSLLKKLN